ncbi:MAG: hypothetical protein ACM37W_08840 [Actinomycetota bacterium]
MSKNHSKSENTNLETWREKIEIANRNNIFCHCRQCGAEWVDSSFQIRCHCGSREVEAISCWQFPDD